VRRVELDAARYQAVAQLLVDFPELDVDRLRALVESNGRRRRVEPIRPRTASEVVALLEAKVVTRAEARRFLGLRDAQARRR
jgi:ribosomal 50S subunit-associated protein YjgA (DUF615 family)